MEKDKGSTLKSIMRSSKKNQIADPYEDYKKSPVTKIYHRITSNTFLPYRWKQALIIGGIIILVVGIITTIAVVISNQESKTPDEVDSTDSDQNMAQIDNQSHNDICTPNPCKNNGECKNEGNDSFICDGCDPGWTGQNCTFSVVRKVQMGIHSSTNCGSEDGVRIELKSKTDLCKTKPYGGFSAGDTLNWTGEQLGNCTTAHFDPMAETISLWIKTSINDKFCPIWVKIILNDETSTSYLLELPNGDWHNIDDKHDVIYSAKKLI